MIEQLTAGVDWLTLTLPVGSERDQEWLFEGLKVLQEIEQEGYDLTARDLLGYGGFSCGNCFVGSREDGHMIQLCGRFADPWFGVLYRRDCNVSRIDVQVTVKHDVMPADIAVKGYKRALHQDNNTRPGGKRKLYIITGSDGGQTLYVGAMSSNQRGRLYNKEVQSESPEFVRTWRYEVVLRGERALPVCDRLLTLASHRPDYISAFVALWWQARGVPTPWQVSDAPDPIPPIKTLPNDVEKQLAWIRSQVAPTIKRLLASGYRDTILAYLGLSIEPHSTDE